MNKEEQETIILILEKMIKHNIGICFREEDITYYFRADEMMNILNYINKLEKENEFLNTAFEYAYGNTLDKRYFKRIIKII